jgi:hypothetical protein
MILHFRLVLYPVIERWVYLITVPMQIVVRRCGCPEYLNAPCAWLGSEQQMERRVNRGMGQHINQFWLEQLRTGNLVDTPGCGRTYIVGELTLRFCATVPEASSRIQVLARVVLYLPSERPQAIQFRCAKNVALDQKPILLELLNVCVSAGTGPSGLVVAGVSTKIPFGRLRICPVLTRLSEWKCMGVPRPIAATISMGRSHAGCPNTVSNGAVPFAIAPSSFKRASRSLDDPWVGVMRACAVSVGTRKSCVW